MSWVIYCHPVFEIELTDMLTIIRSQSQWYRWSLKGVDHFSDAWVNSHDRNCYNSPSCNHLDGHVLSGNHCSDHLLIIVPPISIGPITIIVSWPIIASKLMHLSIPIILLVILSLYLSYWSRDFVQKIIFALVALMCLWMTNWTICA